MPVYGSILAIQQLLRPGDEGAFSVDETARITELRKLSSLLIEHDTGAVFGVTTPETIVVEADGGSRLYLPKGIRALTSITESPDWLLGAWVNGTALTSTAYRLTSQVANGSYRTVTRMDGGWHGTYLIAGVWESAFAVVPDDITWAVNFVAAEGFKEENASPHGLMGPEGALVPIREALKTEKVRRVLDYYRVGPGVWIV